jgi:hypothetical protein
LSVVQVLQRAWRIDDWRSFPGRFAAWDEKLPPACYYIGGRHGDVDVTLAEARALHKERVFAGMSRDREDCVQINEHAKHAFDDFCRDVHAAWQQYLDRLDQIERKGAAGDRAAPSD